MRSGPEPTIPKQPRTVAKLIVHAARTLIAPEIAVPRESAGEPPGLREIADVPWPGTRFRAGDPVMTLLAWGENVADCQARMIDLEREWTERLALAAE